MSMGIFVFEKFDLPKTTKCLFAAFVGSAQISFCPFRQNKITFYPFDNHCLKLTLEFVYWQDYP